MNYIRWQIKEIFQENPDIVLPLIVLSVVLFIMVSVFSTIAGYVILVVEALFWGMVLYVFVSEVFRINYARYQKEKSESETS
jgi:hypothetical protein